MEHRRAGWLLAVLTALVIASQGTSVAATPRSTQTASAGGCPDVMFVGARGSGEKASDQHGLGKEMWFVWQVLKKDAEARGLSAGYTAVTKAAGQEYTADGVDKDFVPTKSQLVKIATAFLSGGRAAALAAYIKLNVQPYQASMTRGITVTKAIVADLVATCPSTQLVLGGYSQGAVAVHDAENAFKQSKNPATKALLNHIAGTLLLGDPDRAPNSKATLFGGAPRTGEGLRPYLRLVRDHDVALPATTAEVQGAHDIVGDFSSWTLGGKTTVIGGAGAAVLPIPVVIAAAPAFYLWWQNKVAPRLKQAGCVHTNYVSTAKGCKPTSGKQSLTEAAHWVASKLSGHTVSLGLGPSTLPNSFPGQLDEDGSTLLTDDSCYGRVTELSTRTSVAVGDDGFCFRNQMSSDGSKVIYPEYRRESWVPDGQQQCPWPHGYLYQWNAEQNPTWVSLNGACHYQVFAMSRNSTFLAAREGESGSAFVLHDLVHGTSTPIPTLDDANATPMGVSNDGNRVVFAATRSLDPYDNGIFLWTRGQGSELIGGGEADTLMVSGFAAGAGVSADAKTVYYLGQSAENPSSELLYRWTADGGRAQVVPGAQNLSVSVADNGKTAAISYDEPGPDETVTQKVGILTGDSVVPTVDVSALTGASSVFNGAISGDGKVVAFITNEALLPDDDDQGVPTWYYITHLN